MSPHQIQTFSIAILMFMNTALVGGIAFTIQQSAKLTRDVSEMKAALAARASAPVLCETVQAKAPPVPEKPKVPEHIAYQLLTTDKSMYAIYLARCKARLKGFEAFETDMTTLNQHPESPQKIPNKGALARIKAGQTWWFPPYCKGLVAETLERPPQEMAQK
jgi:hypothetical protein